MPEDASLIMLNQNLFSRRFQFRLRTLLAMFVVVSIPFGWRAMQLRKEKAAINWVEEMGGEINYGYRPSTTLWEKVKRVWNGRKYAERVYLMYQDVSDITPLSDLKELKVVALNNTTVSDITVLSKLKDLQSVDVSLTNVSMEQVQALQQVLPNCRVNYSFNPPTFWETKFEEIRTSLNRKH